MPGSKKRSTHQGVGNTSAAEGRWEQETPNDIANSIRELLAEEGGLPSERALADRLGIKRHRLREALETMRDNGEIEPPRAGRPRRTPAAGGEEMIRCTNPLEVIELRLILEPALARLAALRATPFDITRIQRAATTAKGMDSGEADLNFHRAIASGAGNSLATQVYQLLRKVATDARLQIQRDLPYCPNRLKQRDAEHKAIADAIMERKPEEAEKAMRDHLMAVREQVLRRMGPTLSVA